MPTSTASTYLVRNWHDRPSCNSIELGLGLAGSTMFNPTFDWTFQSVPQKQANGRTIPQNRYTTLQHLS